MSSVATIWAPESSSSKTVRDRGESRMRRRSPPCRFRDRRRHARTRSASGSGCAHIRSPCARPGSAGRRSRSRRSAPSPRRSSGRGSARRGSCGSRRRDDSCRHAHRLRLKWLIRSTRVIRPTNSSSSKTIATSLRSKTGSSASSVWLGLQSVEVGRHGCAHRLVEAVPTTAHRGPRRPRECRFHRRCRQACRHRGPGSCETSPRRMRP